MKKKKNDLKYKITFIVGIILSVAAIVVISKFANESATRKFRMLDSTESGGKPIFIGYA